MTLIELIRWNWNENFFAMKIVEQLNAIPLFVQITQIVGGVMVGSVLQKKFFEFEPNYPNLFLSRKL